MSHGQDLKRQEKDTLPGLGTHAARGQDPRDGSKLTMTVAMMDSSASLKPSMRWELWVPSTVSSSLLPGTKSPWAQGSGSEVVGPDMVGLLPGAHKNLEEAQLC